MNERTYFTDDKGVDYDITDGVQLGQALQRVRGLIEQIDVRFNLITKERKKHVNILKHVTSEWNTSMNADEVTCHDRMVEGVLCRWWGDGPVPDGVSLINKAAELKDA